MKKILTVAALGALLVAGTIAAQAAGMGAREPELSSTALAGHWAGRATGFVTICLNSDNARVTCGSAGSVPVQFNANLVLASTLDGQGNGCGNFTLVLAPLVGSATALPPLQVAQVLKVTSFDAPTSTGEADFHNFTGGKCVGASFDNTGATAFSNGTLHFAVINNGNQLESMVETDAAADSSFGAETLSWTSTRQTGLRR
jgi:hypothetical protein